MVEATRRAVAASRDILERIDAALPRRIRKPTALVQPATSRMRKGPPAG
ncbi:MAG TPA: hypothetical protein VKB52_08290 [Rhodanobacteraceae bacterium]|nr:hypothetical protein [Rhodanobacteraceae bacterium]